MEKDHCLVVFLIILLIKKGGKMSILIKPYEISVWDDVLQNGVFVEKRLGIIGSDKMTYQGRALEP